MVRKKKILLIFLILLIIGLSLGLGLGLGLNSKEMYPENFFENPSFPIDIVYTWVGESKSSKHYLSNNNELKYSLRSVMKYAPWVNRIYILMNPPKKVPSWFNTNYYKKITLLDHNDTFFNKENLPCTNSNAIETTLINIPNLSEHFIYFNDDTFLCKPTSYRNFFSIDGSRILFSDNIKNCKSMLKGENILKIKFPQHCGVPPHMPFANKKSIIYEYQKEYRDYINWVQSTKTRKPTNLDNLGVGNDICIKNNLKDMCQQQHSSVAKYAYNRGLAEIKKYKVNYCVYNKNVVFIDYNCFNLLDKVYRNPPLFLCINDTKSDDPKIRLKFFNKVNNFFEKFFKEKTIFRNLIIFELPLELS